MTGSSRGVRGGSLTISSDFFKRSSCWHFFADPRLDSSAMVSAWQVYEPGSVVLVVVGIVALTVAMTPTRRQGARLIGPPTMEAARASGRERVAETLLPSGRGRGIMRRWKPSRRKPSRQNANAAGFNSACRPPMGRSSLSEPK